MTSVGNRSANDIEIRALLTKLALAGIDAARPENFIPEALASRDDQFWDRCRTEGYDALAIGKAAASMVVALAAELGDPRSGAVATHSQKLDLPAGLDIVIGGHPVPDEGSLAAGLAVASFVSGRDPHRPLVVLVSGGGSAICEIPRSGVTLDDLVRLNQSLLRSGIPIEECNVVRQALSEFKGGGLAGMLVGHDHRALVVSDVVGNPLESIGSGPLSRPTWRRGDPWDVVVNAGITDLGPNLEGILREVNPGTAESVHVAIVADATKVANAVLGLANQHGLAATIVTTQLTGEAAQRGRECVEQPLEGLSIYTGETTVVVSGSGRGGRNQHAALAAALAMKGGAAASHALMIGTDGRDGPTDAAGGLVDHQTVDRIENTVGGADVLLADDDSHTALEAAGDLIRTGPTGTNVGDLWLTFNEGQP